MKREKNAPKKVDERRSPYTQEHEKYEVKWKGWWAEPGAGCAGPYERRQGERVKEWSILLKGYPCP